MSNRTRARPAVWNVNHRYLHEHPEEIRPDLYDARHPDTKQLVESRVDRPSMTKYNVVEMYDAYGWSGVIDFDPSVVHRELSARTRDRDDGAMDQGVNPFLQKIIIENVNPCKSDLGAMRFQDMYLLYTLITRSLYFSSAYNSMCNICISHFLQTAHIERQGGVYAITDATTHARYTSPLGDQGKQGEQEELQEPAGGHRDGVAPAQGWNMHDAWDSFIQQSTQRYQELRQFHTDVRNWMGTMDDWRQTTDTTLADLTTQMEQLSTTVDDIYSVVPSGVLYRYRVSTEPSSVRSDGPRPARSIHEASSTDPILVRVPERISTTVRLPALPASTAVGAIGPIRRPGREHFWASTAIPASLFRYWTA
ncbi:hypothetical protein LXL04_023491 [Taraxacum kok-saghyz]